jgi:hypothetical protein
MQVIQVKVEAVEIIGAAVDLLDGAHVVGQGIHAALVQPERSLAHRDQLGVGDRVAAGEQGDLVAGRHQLLGKIGNHPLGPTIEFGRNALEQRRDLGYFHGVLLTRRR